LGRSGAGKISPHTTEIINGKDGAPMSYFNGATDPEDYEDGFSEESPVRRVRARRNFVIFALILAALGTSFAANISLNTGARKEFGQGIYQIKACDQWVGIGLTVGANTQSNYVKTVRLYGLDPRLCKGNIFRIKLFPSGSTTPLDMYKGAGTTSAASDSVTATILVTRITNTAYTGTTKSQYDTWAYDAVTLVDPQGRDISYGDTYQTIDYSINTGVYTIFLTYPLALAAQVSSVTIESAKYS
jgi:hypothetical protein